MLDRGSDGWTMTVDMCRLAPALNHIVARLLLGRELSSVSFAAHRSTFGALGPVIRPRRYPSFDVVVFLPGRDPRVSTPSSPSFRTREATRAPTSAPEGVPLRARARRRRNFVIVVAGSGSSDGL